MPQQDHIGSPSPLLVLYLPHRPNGLAQLMETPSAQALIEANSNHWRKIVTLLAKVASPVADDWRGFRDDGLFRHTALCFAPELLSDATWHWIGGRDNLQRFNGLRHSARPLAGRPEVSVDPDKRLLLTPYPDYRQLSNAVVASIRSTLDRDGFYAR